MIGTDHDEGAAMTSGLQRRGCPGGLVATHAYLVEII